METYVMRDAWGGAETRIIGEPVTHKGDSPESVVGRLVLVRPYYKVPGGRSSLSRARSPFVFSAQVAETFGENMVKVRYSWETETPWGREAIFYPGELHVVHVCECAACKGDGIQGLEGA